MATLQTTKAPTSFLLRLFIAILVLVLLYAANDGGAGPSSWTCARAAPDRMMARCTPPSRGRVRTITVGTRAAATTTTRRRQQSRTPCRRRVQRGSAATGELDRREASAHPALQGGPSPTEIDQGKPAGRRHDGPHVWEGTGAPGRADGLQGGGATAAFRRGGRRMVVCHDDAAGAWVLLVGGCCWQPRARQPEGRGPVLGLYPGVGGEHAKSCLWLVLLQLWVGCLSNQRPISGFAGYVFLPACSCVLRRAPPLILIVPMLPLFPRQCEHRHASQTT